MKVKTSSFNIVSNKATKSFEAEGLKLKAESLKQNAKACRLQRAYIKKKAHGFQCYRLRSLELQASN